MLRLRYAAALLGSACLQLACSDSSGPAAAPPFGLYTATLFVIDQDGQHPVDFLAGGSTLTLAIALDSTVTGHLFIPGSLTGDQPFEADMAGRAIMTESTVTFEQDADTFIRDLEFQRHVEYLEAEQPINVGSMYHLKLETLARE